MNLREYLRLDFSVNLRDLLLKEECECCGNKEDLHLHHIDKFHNLLIDTLNELQVNEENSTENYPKEVLLLIRDVMASKQLRIKYKTLCHDCHMKIHGQEKYNDEYKEHVYNPYGNYFFINIKKLLELEPQFRFRFLYLCSHINYENKLTYGNAKKGFNGMVKKDLQEVLDISEREARYTIEAFIKHKMVLFNSDNSLCVGKDTMYKGYKPNGETEYVRFFNDFVCNIYKTSTVFEHQKMGRFFNLLNIINTNNIYKDKIGYNQADICNALGYDANQISRNIGIFFNKNILIKYGRDIFLNPAFAYYGYMNRELKEFENTIGVNNEEVINE